MKTVVQLHQISPNKCRPSSRNSTLIFVDLIDKDKAFENKQKTLDAHDDLVTDLSVHIKQIVFSSTLVNDTSCKILSCKLTRLRKGIDFVVSFFDGGSTDVCLLRQYEERLSDINHSVITLRAKLIEELKEQVPNSMLDILRGHII